MLLNASFGSLHGLTTIYMAQWHMAILAPERCLANGRMSFLIEIVPTYITCLANGRAHVLSQFDLLLSKWSCCVSMVISDWFQWVTNPIIYFLSPTTVGVFPYMQIATYQISKLHNPNIINFFEASSLKLNCMVMTITMKIYN